MPDHDGSLVHLHVHSGYSLLDGFCCLPQLFERAIDPTDSNNGYVEPHEAFLTGDSDEDNDKCRALADQIRVGGAAGMIFLSASAPGGENLAIYIDGPAGGIHLSDGAHRIPRA